MRFHDRASANPTRVQLSAPGMIQADQQPFPRDVNDHVRAQNSTDLIDKPLSKIKRM